MGAVSHRRPAPTPTGHRGRPCHGVAVGARTRSGGTHPYDGGVSSPIGDVDDDGARSDESGLLAANDAFYRAFEEADLDAMSDLWEHSDRVECVHPGWSALRGWGEVAASWATLFGGRQRLQFILTDARAVVVGEVGWVSVDENLLAGDVAGGAGSTGTVAAINVFVRSGGTWRMVAHHGAPVAGRAG